MNENWCTSSEQDTIKLHVHPSHLYMYGTCTCMYIYMCVLMPSIFANKHSARKIFLLVQSTLWQLSPQHCSCCNRLFPVPNLPRACACLQNTSATALHKRGGVGACAHSLPLVRRFAYLLLLQRSLLGDVRLDVALVVSRWRLLLHLQLA